MKISEQWLREWVSPDLDSKQIAHQLTMAGLEVDSISPVAGKFNDVVVGLVEQVTPHPEADRLSICQVDIGKGELLSIVCGANNVRSNLKVAVATIGSILPNGLKIEKTQLRGEMSEGMLCSSDELGLSDSAEGILELDEDAPVGKDLRNYLALDDVVIDIDLTPNRADCLSVMGIAREVATLNSMSYESVQINEVKPEIDAKVSITIDDYEYCGLYCARVVRNIRQNAKTPSWIKERLRRSGIRPIHPVVDVTNYVMLELGQPMHAFDLAKVANGIHVRLANKDEPLTLLDGSEALLREDTLVIADGEKALAIAGVMGGQESAVNEMTVDIFLESAFFNPVKIAGVARSYGLSTDSSHRFERGVDPNLQVQAIERATELLLEIVGGQQGQLLCQKQDISLPQKREVKLRPSRVNKLLGVEIAEDDMLQVLAGLGMDVSCQQSTWDVLVPTHRFDIAIEADLIEEIGRIYGYDNLHEQQIMASLSVNKTSETIDVSHHVAKHLSHQAYSETISYSFVDPKLQALIYPDQQVKQLINPISSELSQMRLGLWPGLLASLIYNQHRQVNDLKLFETGLTFKFEGSQLLQKTQVGGLIAGKVHENQWNQSTRDVDFYDIKGDIDALLASIARFKTVKYLAAEHPALHPGQSAHIMIDDEYAGICGALHPNLARVLDISTPVFLFELSIDALCRSPRAQYKSISKYPMIRRDLAFLANHMISADEIKEQLLAQDCDNCLQRVDIFDVYSGEGIPEGKKSIALGLTLQHPSRTLIDDEINQFVAAIIKRLGENLKLQLRE
jgi:phenylalanyl-tRNA synthetase beta chain